MAIGTYLSIITLMSMDKMLQTKTIRWLIGLKKQTGLYAADKTHSELKTLTEWKWGYGKDILWKCRH